MRRAVFHRSIVRALALGGAAWLIVASAAAQDTDFDQVIDSRQRNLRDMGAAYKAIGDQLKKSKPNISEMARYAGSMQDIASSQKQWFPAGSGAESGVKTAAKAEIWSQPAEFIKWEDELTTQLNLLVKVTGGSDVEAVRLQHEQVGKACAGCHKVFREKDD
jgi:cytochrome c556